MLGCPNTQVVRVYTLLSKYSTGTWVLGRPGTRVPLYRGTFILRHSSTWILGYLGAQTSRTLDIIAFLVVGVGLWAWRAANLLPQIGVSDRWRLLVLLMRRQKRCPQAMQRRHVIVVVVRPEYAVMQHGGRSTARTLAKRWRSNSEYGTRQHGTTPINGQQGTAHMARNNIELTRGQHGYNRELPEGKDLLANVPNKPNTEPSWKQKRANTKVLRSRLETSSTEPLTRPTRLCQHGTRTSE